MTKVTLEVPEDVSEREVRLLVALKLFELGRLSMGQAAEMSGYSKPTFMELAGSHGVSVFNYSPEELEQEPEL